MKSTACLPVAIFAAVLLLAGCAGDPDVAEEPEELEEPASGRLAAGAIIAIFDFELKGGDSAYEALRTDLPEAVSEALVKGGLLRPVERNQLKTALAEQEFALSGLVDDSTAARIGRLAGARYALLGSASIIDGQVRLSCRIIDVETAEIVFAESVYGEVKDVFELAKELAGKVEDEFSN